MQLISCTHCHRTWELEEEEKPAYLKTGNYVRDRDERPGVDIRPHHDTPCFHKYTVETNPPYTSDTVSAFKEIPYISTLPDALDIDFVSLLLRKEVTNRNLIEFHSAMLEGCSSILEIEHSIGGEHEFLHEAVQYHGQEVSHSSYFEAEVPLHVFSISELRVLGYLYRKNPTMFLQCLEDWYKEHNSMAAFNRTFEDMDKDEL